MMIPRMLVVDTKLYAYKQFYAGQSILGLLDEVKRDYEAFYDKAPTKIVWAFDKGRSFRNKLYPEYKAQRLERLKKQSKADQRKHKQFHTDYLALQDYLQNFGEVVQLDGYEADDVASVIAERFHKDWKVVLLSSDSDWVKFQDDGVVWIKATKTGRTLYDFPPDLGYPTELKPKVDALIGVAKENVGGIKRFGIKTFIKLYEEVGGDFEALLSMLSEKYDNSKAVEPFNTVQELFEFNYELFRRVRYDELTDDAKSVVDKLGEFKIKTTQADKILFDEYFSTPPAGIFAPPFCEFYRIK